MLLLISSSCLWRWLSGDSNPAGPVSDASERDRRQVVSVEPIYYSQTSGKPKGGIKQNNGKSCFDKRVWSIRCLAAWFRHVVDDLSATADVLTQLTWIEHSQPDGMTTFNCSPIAINTTSSSSS